MRFNDSEYVGAREEGWAVKSNDSNGYPTHHDPMASPDYIASPYPIVPFQMCSPGIDLPANQENKLTSNGSASDQPEDAYIAMDRVGTPSKQQHLSAISGGNPSKGEYRLSIC